MSKGISEIASMALYIGITVTAISGAVTVGLPSLENMQEAASIEKAQNFMQDLDSNVQQVASEGEGSTRTLTVSFDRGTIYFDENTDSLIYELRTDAEVISPQTSKQTGNLILSSSANVKVNETTIDGTPCYFMQNEHIQACIRKVGSEDKDEPIDTSDLLVMYKSRETGQRLNANMTVELNEDPTTSNGQGYTYVPQKGEFLGTGKVIATVKAGGSTNFVYDVIIQLPTGADFLKVDVQNFR